MRHWQTSKLGGALIHRRQDAQVVVETDLEGAANTIAELQRVGFAHSGGVIFVDESCGAHNAISLQIAEIADADRVYAPDTRL